MSYIFDLINFIKNKIEMELTYSKIISTQSNGLPAEIQVAPCYRDSYSANGWIAGTGGYYFEDGADHEDGVVDIVFPGVDPVHFPGSVNMPRLALTSDMLSASCSSTEEGSVAGLVDRRWKDSRTQTSTYWHSPYSPQTATDNETYGIYIDIYLKGNTLQNFALAFCLRDVIYNHPKHVKIYGSTTHNLAGPNCSIEAQPGKRGKIVAEKAQSASWP